MRNTTGIQTHLEGKTLTLAVCWKITRTDGQEFGYTTHTRPLVIDGLTYVANGGLESTSSAATAGTEVNRSKVIGFIKPGLIDSESLRLGRWDHAEVEKFVVNYLDPLAGRVLLEWGTLGEVQYAGPHFEAESRGADQWMSLQVVDVIQATCRWKFGDPSTCRALVHSITGTVASVPTGKTITAAALIGAYADGYFALGRLHFNTGPLAGLDFDVRSYTASTGTLAVQLNYVVAPVVGNSFTVYEGCARTVAACKTKTRADTLAVNNIFHYGGEPDTPGNDFVLKVQKPQ